MWTGDNLDIMRGMNSESVDLIYLDPPFNSNRTYSAPIGSQAAGPATTVYTNSTFTRRRSVSQRARPSIPPPFLPLGLWPVLLKIQMGIKIGERIMAKDNTIANAIAVQNSLMIQ